MARKKITSNSDLVRKDWKENILWIRNDFRLPKKNPNETHTYNVVEFEHQQNLKKIQTEIPLIVQFMLLYR